MSDSEFSNVSDTESSSGSQQSVEDVPVAIIGAGPSGLALALALAQHQIKSVILEKEFGIGTDPRGVYLAEDAVRILYNLGIGHRMKEIGHVVPTINFHKTILSSPPFLLMHPNRDILTQTVPDGILQVQPKLEKALRDAVEAESLCELRQSCTVVAIEDQKDSMLIRYVDPEDSKQTIRCSYLVGADGKKGIVRKHFLEPKAGIVQKPGVFPYEGTWIAANFKITPPTPETHPDFLLWEYGYSPEEVYDLFWPKGWHFCSPPGVPVACGRFGPMEDRFWRHEISVPDWEDSMDCDDMLMTHVMEQMTRSSDSSRHFEYDVQFPRDCIEVLRCRPFRFAHKVVNKWYDDRVILIGDAAHVFPPFGGQGIACGVKDSFSLAWRLAMLLRMQNPTSHLREDLLSRWSQERNQSVYDSGKLTTMSGALCNEEDEGYFWGFRQLVSFISKMPLLENIITFDSIQTYRAGYRPMQTGFFLHGLNGGRRLPQVYVQTASRPPFLSDQLLQRPDVVLTLFIIDEYPRDHLDKVRQLIQAANLDPAFISEKSITMLTPNQGSELSFDTTVPKNEEVVGIAPKSSLGDKELLKFYDGAALINQLGTSTKFVIIRPDFIIFAAVKSYDELKEALHGLGNRLHA